MPATSFACPECRSVLRTTTPLPAGKKVKCPKCSAVFAVPGAEERAATAIRAKDKAPPPPPPRRRPVEDEEMVANSPRPVRRRPVEDEDEDLPRRRPVDDEEQLDEDRPRRRKKKKKQSSNVGLIVIVSSVVVLLLGGFAVTAFVWPGFLRSTRLAAGTGNENLLAFVPAPSNLLIGGNLKGVVGAAQEGLEQARGMLVMQGAPVEVLEALKEADRFVFAASTSGQKFGVLVVLTKAAYEKEKMKKALNASDEKRVQGKPLFKLQMAGRQQSYLGMPNDRVLLLGDLTENDFGPVLASDGTTSKVGPNLEAQVRKVQNSQFWGAIAFDGALQQQLQMLPLLIGPDVGKKMPEVTPLISAVSQAKGAAFGIEELADKGVRLQAHLTCANDPDANQAKKAIEGLWGKVKGMLGMVGLMAGFQQGGQAVSKVLNELNKTFKVQSQGPELTASVELSGQTVQELQQQMQQMGGAFGPGGFGPGGGPPGMPGGFPPGGPGGMRPNFPRGRPPGANPG